MKSRYQLSAVASVRFLPVPLFAHLNVTGLVRGKMSLSCQPNQTQFHGYVQYTDQSCHSTSTEERHALEKELYVPGYFRKISKAALLKEKRAQL